MKEFEEQGGISFILIYFSKIKLAYYLTFKELKRFWSNKKDIKQDDLVETYLINMNNKIKLPILEKLQIDIDER